MERIEGAIHLEAISNCPLTFECLPIRFCSLRVTDSILSIDPKAKADPVNLNG